MADVILHGLPPSTYTWTARLVCEEKGISHDLKPVEFGSPAHLALHPYGKIPVMEIGQFRLYETIAIARYIDAMFGGPALQPADAKQRAEMDQWINAVSDYWYDVFVRKLVFNRLVRPSRGLPVVESEVEQAVPLLDRYLASAEAVLSKHDYLAGPSLSLADLFLAPILFHTAATEEGKRALAKAPKVSAWLQKMQARPSVAATMPQPPAQSAAAE